MTYELWYWPGFTGRGEFVRLALEAAGIDYRDVGPEEGREHVTARLTEPCDARPFAPPFLVAGDLVIAQTANILLYLGEVHGLAPADMAGRLWVNQCQLTIGDMVAEAHNSHHPVGASLYYEEQAAEAQRAAQAFRTVRMPKYLGYFDALIARRGGRLGGAAWSYADLSLLHLVDGLRHAFPRRMRALEAGLPHLAAHRDTVAALPRVAAYLVSPRCQPFGNGVFRHYPELDAD